MAIRPPFTAEQQAELDARHAAGKWRPAYVSPPHTRHAEPSRYKQPWRELTERDVEQWRARNLPERWACEPGIAMCLAWLEREFGGLTDPEGT